MVYKLPTFTAFGRSPDFVLPVAIRSIQILFVIIALATAAASVSGAAFSFANMALATSVIAFVYLVATLFAYPFVNSLTILIAESILTILWLIAFALITNLYGGGSCSWDTVAFVGWSTNVNHFSSTSCKAGKANIAFSFFSWIFSIFTLVTHIIYTVVPLSKSKDGLFFTHILGIGGIFYVPNEALSLGQHDAEVAPARDLEAGELSLEPKEFATATDPLHTEGDTIPEVSPPDHPYPVNDPIPTLENPK